MRNNIGDARRSYALSVGGFTQEDAASFFGVSLGTYRNWEQGVGKLNGEILCAIADKYECSTDYLLCRTSDPAPYPPARCSAADDGEEEFIRSFLNAAKELAAAGRRAIDRPGMYVMLKHSYAIPVLFLTRHCMELAIKRVIRKCGVEPKREHSLTKLWSSLLSRFPGQRCREDNRAIKNMGAFVEAVADIDDNGISLRYPQDSSGRLTQDRPLFVNDEEVASYLEKFVEQLELIDFDMIHRDVK